MNLRRILGLAGAALAVLVLQLGCVDLPEGASVSGTSLYVFDSVSGNILVWADANQVYNSASLPAADRTISGTSLLQVKTLGWGGMAMDPTNNRLLLVSQTGKVVCIHRVRTQNGDLSSLNDIVLFTLGSSSDRLSNGVFGQAAVDATTGTLYVTETNDSAARIWVVSNPGSISDGATVALSQIQATSGTDTNGTGVAAAQSRVYAYFGGGDNITSASATTYSGARVRQSQGSSFPAAAQVLIYNSTDAPLGTTGSLGLDTSNNLLYVLRIGASGSVGDPPVVVYTLGRFTSSFDQSWDATLGTAAGEPHLRVISHAGNKDWLAGADMVSSAGTSRIWLWRNPSVGGSPHSYDLSGAQILGVAFDGSN